MPCNAAPYPRYSSEDMDAVEIYYQAEIDRVTRVACEAIKALKRNALYDSLSPEVKAWSHEHDAWDAAKALVDRSIKATARRSTFDDKENAIDYGDGRSALSDDDINDLRVHDDAGYNIGYGSDQELSRQIAEDAYEEMLSEQEAGDDLIEEELTNDAFVNNVRAQRDETEEPKA